jgi:hypothetical protein
MASAQQPTMADVFMDRFRQGGQDRMAAQKMQSDMAMNEAYKNAQMQKMKDDAANALLQRRTQFLQAAGGVQGVTPDTRAGWSATGAELDLPDSMFPTQQFQETPVMQDVEPNLTPSSLRFSTQEDMGGPTQVGTERLPIGNTGYSPQLEYLRDMMDLKGQAAANKTANGQGKPYKFGDPVARLIEEARMMAEAGHPMPKAVFDDRMSLLRTYLNPNAAGAYSQGVAVAPRLAPMTLPDSAYPEPHQPAQPQQQSPTPVQQFNTAVDGIKDKKAAVVAPVMKAAGVTPQPPAQQPKAAGPVTVAKRSTPLTPKGAQDVAKFTQAHDTAIDKLDDLSQLIDKIKDSPGLERAIGKSGANNRSDWFHTDKEAYEAWSELERLMQAGTLKELKDLRATGTTLGQVSNQEGERLEKSFSTIKPFGSYQQALKELDRIQKEVHTSRKNVNKGASGLVGSLGQAPIEFHEIGEQKPDPDGNVWEYRGKTYADKKNWRMVKKAGGN